MTNQEYRIKPGAGLEALQPGPAETKPLAPGQVRIAVRAVALNGRDLLIARGLYPVPHARPIVLCSDGAGVVTEAGSGTGYAVGDRVVGSFFRAWHDGPATPEAVATSYGCEVDGWLAREVVIDGEALVRIPDGLSFAEAASAPCAGVTAWNALLEAGQLRSGSTLLVQGTGGVAAWAVQIAAAAGIRTISTSSSDEKLAKFRTLGASHAINYVAKPDWSDEAVRLTEGRGVDLVLELGGQATIQQSLRAVRFGGRIAVVGGLSGWQYDDIPPLTVATRQLTLTGIHVGNRRMLESLLGFVAEHRIQPLVSKTFGFEAAQDAFVEFDKARHVGKVVIGID